jgi:tripartite-type tricarboxylate transporter receptor subunit TctC
VNIEIIELVLTLESLRPIGIGSAQRAIAAPEIPTMIEQGLPNYLVEGWFALVGPKGLPTAETSRLQVGLVEAFNTPELKELMAKQGNAINISSTESAGTFFKSELAKYARLVKKLG